MTNLAPKEKDAGGSKTSQEKKRQAGLGNLPKKKKEKEDIEVMVMEMIDGRQHPDSVKLRKAKKFTDSDGNIEFRAKGGRVGYKMGSKCKLAKRGKGRAYGKNS